MPGRLQRIEMAQHLLRVVDLRAFEPARAGHALVASTRACGVGECRSKNCQIERQNASRSVTDQRHSAS